MTSLKNVHGSFSMRVSLAMFCCIMMGSMHCLAQPPDQPTAEEQKELQANQRFEEILRKRPRPGTALDRVYEFHVARGSIETFCQTLQNEIEEKNSGQAALLLGLIQSQRGNDSDARAAFEKAEELLTTEPLASYYLGKTLLLVGDVDRAIAALQRAIERKPEKADSLQIFQELGRVYQRLRRSEDALNVWKRMEAMFPGDLQVQEQIANILEEEGANSAALERFTALAAATKDRFRQVELGVRAAALKIKLNDHSAALTDFESLLSQINPGSWLYQDIRRRIDESFQSRQDSAGLTAYYQRWIDKHPDDIDAMMRIGRLLSIAHNSAAAKEWFARAIERAPSAVEPRLALIEALERDGNNSAAAGAMQTLCELKPDNPDYLVRWGELLLSDFSRPEASRAAAAADVWRKLLVKNNTNPVMLARVADLMRSANLSDEALQLYRRAVELSENEPQYREYLGEYLHRLDRRDEALQVWRELASGPRKNRDNLVRLSEVLSTFGLHPEALEAMKEACQLQPTFAQRLRYVDKLIDATHFEDGLAQLDLAAKQSSNEEEQDKLLEHEIKVHLAKGDMAQRIAELETQVEKADAKSVMAWKRLAMYQEADGKTQPALQSISQAVALAPQSGSLLNIASRLQEKAGMMGDAVASLRKLIALDRRGQSRILMQVASIQLRLGQVDEAIKTAQEMLTSDAGTEQVRYYADLCFQAGKVDQGLDALRRNMRANPNDREAISLVARALSNNFRTEEAIELTWRAFAKATNMSDRTVDVQSLTELYLRSNAFDDLVKRLEIYGREENRAREAIMLTAVAHQASGDLAAARQLLDPLATSDTRDAELLNRLIELARADDDWEAAASYQTRLNNLSPTPEGGMQLAKFLLEKGDVEQAETIWNKYAAQKMSVEEMQNTLRHLQQSGEIDKVIAMVDRALKNAPDDWETLSVCAQTLYRCEKDAEAKELAAKLVKLNLPKDTLSESAKRQRSRQASTNPSRATNNALTPARLASFSSPYSSMASSSPTATDRLSCMYRASLVTQSMTLERSNPGLSRQIAFSTPALVCYEDARLIALSIQSSPYILSDDLTLDVTDQLKSETNIEKLWDLAFVANAQPRLPAMNSSGFFMIVNGSNVSTNSNISYFDAGGGANDRSRAWKRLAELGDHPARLCLVNEYLNRYYARDTLRQSNRLATSIGTTLIDPNVLNEQLALLKQVLDQPTSAMLDPVILLTIHVASDLKAIDRQQESRDLLQIVQQQTRNRAKLSYAIALLECDPEAAINMFVAALRQSSTSNPIASTSGSNSFSNPEVSYILNDLLSRPSVVAGLETESASANLNRANPLRLISELKKLQAERARRMRPSQLANYTPANTVRYLIQSNNAYARGSTLGAVPFPATSALQSEELLMAMHMILKSPSQIYQDELGKLLEAEARQADDDAMQSAVDHLCFSIWLWWTDRKLEAIQEIEAVEKTAVANDLSAMLASRMYFETGQIDQALKKLQSLKPTTAQLTQERELAILQLASQTHNDEMARRAAERLFAMRLPPQTQMQVASMLQQLDMKEMADSMLQRLQTRSGNQLPALKQLMNQYQSENKRAAAQEVARQILRRTRNGRSMANSGARSNNDSYRREALAALAGSPEIKQQIEQFEAKLKSNPKSVTVINQLAELYEASGRSSDASRILATIQTSSKVAAQSAVVSRLNSFRQTRTAESVKGYLEIFEKNPQSVAQEFPYFQMAVQQHKAWDTVANTISEWPIARLTGSPQWSDMIQSVIANASPTSQEKLLSKLLESDDFLLRFASAFSQRGAKWQWTAATQSKVVQKICQALVDPKCTPENVRRLAGEPGKGLLAAVNSLVDDPQSAKTVLETTAPLSANSLHLKCLEVLMYLTENKASEAEKAFQQVQSFPKPDTKTLEYQMVLWELADVLSSRKHQDWAIALLVPICEHPQIASTIEVGPKALLLACYEALRDFDSAKPLLDEYYADLQKQARQEGDQLGNVQNIFDTTIRLANRYNMAGYRLEALSVVLWLKHNTTVLRTVSVLYGGRSNTHGDRLNRLERQFKEQLSAVAVEQIISRELNPPDKPTATTMPLPLNLLLPNVEEVAQRVGDLSCELSDLMMRLNEDSKIKASVQQQLDRIDRDNWQELSTRRLVCCLYVADFLGQQDVFISGARELAARLLAAQASDNKKVDADIKTLRPTGWIFAEKLIRRGQPALALQLAEQAASSDAIPKLSTYRMELRMAELLKATDQAAAAEHTMRTLLEELFPPAADGRQKNDGANK